MDNQQSNQLNEEFIPLDSKSVPLYDRGYSMVLTSTDGSPNLEGGLEIVNASRCFNCGSYNHSLKDCPKPRDNVAVNNARRQHMSKRNQNSNSRNPTRYYENTPGGKYDGLRPGVLDAETRHILGLGEFDPPPWLNRMREIGYPPGYLDPEEDQPSGITIFADEESREEKSKEEKEDGEIFETGYPEPPKKMSVEFPGINGPIPENAAERLWTGGPSSSDSHRNRSLRRFNPSSEQHISRGRQYHEQRWSRDEGPPGCEPFNATLSGYSPRYSFHESSYGSQSARGNISIPGPSFGRSLSDRVRNHLVHEGSPNRDTFTSVPYSPPVRLFSPLNYGSASSENWDYDSPRDFNPDFSSRHRHDKHLHHHHSWRE